MRGRRRGEANVQTSEWTIQRAASLGLTNKQQWKTQPQAMLTARATAEIARLVGADVILGIPYAAEELTDLEDGPTTTVRRSERKTTARRSAPPAPPEPDAEPPAVTVERIETTSAPGASDDDASGHGQPDADHPAPSVSAEREARARGGNRGQSGPVTEAQLRMLGALLKGQSREQALAVVSSVLGRDVESRKDLTVREAGQVIDALQAAGGAS
jgi:hypothetical protein